VAADEHRRPAAVHRRVPDLLKDSREELARIVTLENGKTIKESRAEVDSALVEGGYHLQQAAGFYPPPPRLRRTGAGSDLTTWVKLEPLGVAGIISPWNFPMNVMCRKTLPALLTGNTVVFKPATFTPWSGIFMTRLFSSARDFRPASSTASRDSDRQSATRSWTIRGVRAVSFTGSTAVGKMIQARRPPT